MTAVGRAAALIKDRLPVLLLVGGLLLLAAAFSVDWIRGSSGDVGRVQLAAASLGALLASAGAGLATPRGRAWLGRLSTDAAGQALTRGLKLAGVGAQVGLLVVLVRQFRIESPAFYDRVAPLVLWGFLLHHLLPSRWRLTGFLALSLAGIGVVFGAVQGAWIVGLGLALIGVCHLPIPFRWRVATLIAVGAALGAGRAGVLPVPWSGAIWPILASMFMFRLIAYLYDLRHATGPIAPAATLSYFFLLPNVAFPLFPVVDFNTFRRTYYDRDPFTIYQDGVRWMARGLTHLILYRLIYRYFTVSPADITTARELVQYMLANFGLYLRVSGQFHLIVGMLHLFGFRLPASHRFFYLAASFADFWRRINIYWKDFMTKLVYNPAFFALRRRGETSALVVATFLVFVTTWFLHSYQWFWLLGTELLSWTDVLFWTILAGLLAANVVWETRHGRTRALAGATWPVRERIATGLGAVATFTVICTLWTLWTSPTLEGWLELFRGTRLTAADAGVVAMVLATIGGAAALLGRRNLEAAPARSPLATLASLAPLLALGLALLPPVAERLSPRAREVVRDLRVVELNRRDAALLQRGYYERIVGVNRFGGELWNVYARRDREWPLLTETGATARAGDIRWAVLRPYVAIVFHGAPFRTNRWGMRDLDYAKEAGPGTFRVAVLGSSYVLGDGVGDGETFEALVEDRLNRERPIPGIARYELLNFAMEKYGPVAQLTLLDDGAPFAFGPDVVLFVAHPHDYTIENQLVLAGQRGLTLPYDTLAGRLRAAGIGRHTPFDDGVRRLRPYSRDLLGWTLDRMAERIRARGALPVWAYVPTPYADLAPDHLAWMAERARTAGFLTLDLSDVYAGHDERELIVADWDHHPNVQGHRLIADALYAALREHPELFTRQPRRRAAGATTTP